MEIALCNNENNLISVVSLVREGSRFQTIAAKSHSAPPANSRQRPAGEYSAAFGSSMALEDQNRVGKKTSKHTKKRTG